MVTIAPQTESAYISPFNNMASSAISVGSVGRSLAEKMREIYAHWNASESIRKDDIEKLENGGNYYIPFPAKATFKVLVKYRYTGKAKPIPYDSNDDE